MQYVILFFLLVPLFGNDLENAASPYLQQHKSNPVKWHIWSERTFQLAKQENKPIFLLSATRLGIDTPAATRVFWMWN